MDSGTTVCFYLTIGIGVAAALWLRRDPRIGASGIFQILSAPFFWPIYIPVLLVHPDDRPTPASLPPGFKVESDDLESLISGVETELDAALHSLTGWADNAMSSEHHRIAELKRALHQQADHIRELDRLLTLSPIKSFVGSTQHPDDVSVDTPETTASSSPPSPETSIPVNSTESPYETLSRVSDHEQRRSRNIATLNQIRQRLYDDMIATLAWIRELVTMIHLAKFTGAPACRAQELVSQIAAAVEGLTHPKRL